MKNLKLIGFLMIIASSLMFIQCTTDTLVGPQGPAGADGVDGIDGIDGIDGLDGLDGIDGLDGASIAECIACHSDSFRDPIRAAFDLSLHNLGTHNGGNTNSYGSRESCSQCHGESGYIDYVNRGFVKPGGYYGTEGAIYEIDDNGTPDDESDDFVVLDDDEDSPTFGLPVITNDWQYNAAKISCNTCHDEHRSFDFENDGNDMALRQGFMPVTLIADPSYTIDMGRSNTCVNCHQPRDYGYNPPVPGPTEDFEVTSTRYGPHHGPQSTVLEGIMGAEIAGSLSYPARGTSKHREATCTGCHMGETTDGTDGGHTFWVTDNACLQCHSSVPSADGSFDADMATLKAKLIALGVLQENNRTIRGTYPANVTQALWNYKTLLEDKSHGVHNPAYTRALLKNSIDAL
jgi:hypothetical protein